MYTIIKKNLSQYINDSIKIAKSLHIYLDTLKIQSRIMTYKLYGQLVDDEENKYVLNMSGLLSTVDDEVMINTDTGAEILNRELIANKNNVKEALLKFDSTYDTVVNNNKTMATYIKGTLALNSLEETLTAKDGQILWYNKDLLNDNEKIVIDRVQGFIYDFLDIYHNQDYVVDELYAAGLVSNLYSLLPMVILTEKLKLVKTYRADDFHIYNFFKSYKALDNEMDILNKETLVWLYGNINYLKKNIGKNETLQILLSKVLDSLGLGVGKMTIEKTLPLLLDDTLNLKTTYYTRELKAKQFKLNNSFSLNIGKVEKVEDVLKREEKQGYIKNTNTVISENSIINEKMRYNNPTKELTKVLPIDSIYLINLDDMNKFAYFLNSIVYQSDISDSEYSIDFFNPADGIIYKLNSQQVLGLLLHLMARIFINNGNPFIKTLQYSNVLDLEAVKNFNVDNYKLDDTEKKLVNVILKDLDKIPSNIDTLESFKVYFNVSYDILHKFWYYLSNVNDVIYSTDLLFVINSLFSSGTSNIIRNRSLQNYLADVYNPITEISDELVVITFKRLVETITGVNIYKVDRVKTLLNKILKLSGKFTSYTIQFLYSNDLSYVITGHYQTLKTNLGKKSYLTVNNAEYSYYDKVEKSIMNKFLPIKEIILNKNNVDVFRLYKPYKLKITNLNDITMLTKSSDVSYIRTGYGFPQMMKPETVISNTLNTDYITDKSIYTTGLITTYNPDLEVHKEAISDYSYVENKDSGTMPSIFKPGLIDHGEDRIADNTVDGVKYSPVTKPILKDVPELTTVRADTNPNNVYINTFTPEASGVDPSSDISVSEYKSHNHKFIVPANITSYNNIYTTQSAINFENIKFYSPEVFNFGDAEIHDYVTVRNIKNKKLEKPIMRNVPELLSDRGDISYQDSYLSLYGPNASGVDPSDDIVIDSYSVTNYKLGVNPDIISYNNIYTRQSSVNFENMKFYSPEIFNFDDDKIYDKTLVRDIKNKKLIRPVMRNVPELLSTRGDMNYQDSYLSLYGPNASGVDPSDDIVIDNYYTTNYNLGVKPKIVPYNNIYTPQSNLNFGNIRFYQPGIYNSRNEKIEGKESLPITYTRIMEKPIAKNTPEILGQRNDVSIKDRYVNLYSPSAGGVDPSDDVVSDNANTTKIRNVEQSTIRVTPTDDMEDIPVIKIRR